MKTSEGAGSARYAICFDFPELNGEPLFAGFHDGAMGFAFQLDTAAKFDSEDEAERWLKNGWSVEVAEFGTVVEVGS